MEIIAAIAALCIGILIGMCLFQDRPVGDLRVDHSDFADEGPHLYLELDTDIPHYCAVQPPYLEPHALKTGYGRLWARPAQAAAARLFAFLHIFCYSIFVCFRPHGGKGPY